MNHRKTTKEIVVKSVLKLSTKISKANAYEKLKYFKIQMIIFINKGCIDESLKLKSCATRMIHNPLVNKIVKFKFKIVRRYKSIKNTIRNHTSLKKIFNK